MICPCKDCDKRKVGCHSECNKYKDWCIYDRDKKEKIKEQQKYDWSDNYYLPSRAGKRKRQP